MEFVYAIGLEVRKRELGENAIRLRVADFDDNWKVYLSL